LSGGSSDASAREEVEGVGALARYTRRTNEEGRGNLLALRASEGCRKVVGRSPATPTTCWSLLALPPARTKKGGRWRAAAASYSLPRFARANVPALVLLQAILLHLPLHDDVHDHRRELPQGLLLPQVQPFRLGLIVDDAEGAQLEALGCQERGTGVPAASESSREGGGGGGGCIRSGEKWGCARAGREKRVCEQGLCTGRE
jgi:hypothetical protein